MFYYGQVRQVPNVCSEPQAHNYSLGCAPRARLPREETARDGVTQPRSWPSVAGAGGRGRRSGDAAALERVVDRGGLVEDLHGDGQRLHAGVVGVGRGADPAGQRDGAGHLRQRRVGRQVGVRDRDDDLGEVHLLAVRVRQRPVVDGDRGAQRDDLPGDVAGVGQGDGLRLGVARDQLAVLQRAGDAERDLARVGVARDGGRRREVRTDATAAERQADADGRQEGGQTDTDPGAQRATRTPGLGGGDALGHGSALFLRLSRPHQWDETRVVLGLGYYTCHGTEDDLVPCCATPRGRDTCSPFYACRQFLSMIFCKKVKFRN